MRWEGWRKLAWACAELGDPTAAGPCLTSEVRPGEHGGPQRPPPTHSAPSQQDKKLLLEGSVQTGLEQNRGSPCAPGGRMFLLE